MKHWSSVTIVGTLLVSLIASPALARDDEVQIFGSHVGTQRLTSNASGQTQAEYGFKDRGRGDRLSANWTLDARGLPLRYSAQGNDYWLAPVIENFEVAGGRATWKNVEGVGETAWSDPGAFYLPTNAPPEFKGVLARALLMAPQQRLRLLPTGEAWLEQGTTVQDGARKLTLYRIGGIELMPVSVWLDEQGATAVVIDDWFEVLEARTLPLLSQLQAAQGVADRQWHAQLAKRLTHVPKASLLIRHARLFDPRDQSVRGGISVLVEGEHVVRVAADEDPAMRASVPADAEIIDAADRFLMPGLWDVHQHFGDTDGVFDLIAGVTSARDMANDNVPLLARAKRFDEGTELGPRMVLAGIIEGNGPQAAPTDVRVETLEQARKAVDWYADRGYEQIKIYSSFKPELVRPTADMAHARGLRVSGHVPDFMSPRAFVEAGADEIQHMRYVALNSFPDRGQIRITDEPDLLHELNLDDARFTDFVTFLREHHTVLDPTIVLSDGAHSGAQVVPALRQSMPRFPPFVRRRLLTGALPVPAGKEAIYSEALPKMLRMLKRLHDGGVTLMAGTDVFAGYSLQRELELYVQAGISPAEVLRMATLTPAEVLGVAAQRGVIAPGKLADMVLIDGDPLQRIQDIRRVYRTIKGGKVFDPAELEQAMGMTP